MAKKTPIEPTELQLELANKINAAAKNNKDINIEDLLSCIFRYVKHSVSRTFFLRDLLNNINKDVNAKKKMQKKLLLKQITPDQSCFMKKEPQKALITRSTEPIEHVNDPVPVVKSIPVEKNATRFNLPVKKPGEFNWSEDLPTIQKLIFKKAFNENVNSTKDVNVSQLAKDPTIVEFLRGQVEFVFQTIKDAKEKIGNNILNAICPRCKKRIDFWGMQKSQTEEIVVFFKNVDAAKKGEFVQAYHKECLIEKS